MASYETEHASDDTSRPSERSRRPDLSSFFSMMSEISSEPPEERTRPGAVPLPADMSAAYRTLADAFRVMQRDNDNADTDLMEQMIETLMSSAERPPTEVKGVEEEWIAQLERVSIKKVKKDADCPICGNAFVEDPHPLLIRERRQQQLEEIRKNAKPEDEEEEWDGLYG